MEPAISLDEAQRRVSQLKAPRITLAGIKAKIKATTYLASGRHPTLTIALVEMENGFIVLGKSAPMSAENFDPEVGRRYAFEDAVKQLWALEAYTALDRGLRLKEAEALEAECRLFGETPTEAKP